MHPGRSTEVADFEHLRSFARSRQGVEGFFEPATTVVEATLVLVANDGEWTRRRVASIEEARRLGRDLGMPVYEVGLVGYPERMRRFNRRRRESEGKGTSG